MSSLDGDLEEVLLDGPEQPDTASGKWATVTQLAPLRVRLDGEAADAVLTPELLCGPVELAARVWVQVVGKRLFVLGPPAFVPSVRNPNLVINGDFRVNERAVPGTGYTLDNGEYLLDRWKNTSGVATAVITWTGDDDVGRVLTLGITGAGRFITQLIEQRNIKPGYYTLSWEGNCTARIYNRLATVPGVVNSPATVYLDGADDVRVDFWGDGRTVANVKLEAGTVATPFIRDDWGRELARCQRYFYRVGSQTGAVEHLGTGFATSANNARYTTSFPVTMRATPTVTFHGTVKHYDGALMTSAVALAGTSLTNARSGSFQLTAAGGLTVNRPMYLIQGSTGANVDFDAEM